MAEVNLTEAFGRYKTKAAPRVRSAKKDDGTLVLSCWYARFQRIDANTLRYEEDLTNETGSAANLLRTHIAEALAQEIDVRLIVAITQPHYRMVEGLQTQRPSRTSFHARKDLLGRVTAFDGQRFVIDFRKDPPDAP